MKYRSQELKQLCRACITYPLVLWRTETNTGSDRNSRKAVMTASPLVYKLCILDKPNRCRSGIQPYTKSQREHKVDKL